MRSSQTLRSRARHRLVAELRIFLSCTLKRQWRALHCRFNRRRNLPAAFARLLGIGTHLRGPTYAPLHVDASEPGGWQHPDAARAEPKDLPW